MLRIILNELAINGYNRMDENDGFVYLKHRNYDDFWIVCYSGFSLDTQGDLYEHYIERFAPQHPRVRRNTSLIILAEVGTNTPEEIVTIENNPYLFKKYYLSYTQEASNALFALLNTQDGELLPVEAFMVNPDVFACLKQEETNGAYHLLYAIAHKLPILPVRVSHEEVLGAEFQLDAEQQECLEWCMGLSDNAEERKLTIEQFSREER